MFYEVDSSKSTSSAHPRAVFVADKPIVAANRTMPHRIFSSVNPTPSNLRTCELAAPSDLAPKEPEPGSSFSVDVTL